VDVRPLTLVTGYRHNLVYLENVRVPRSALIGEENRGWYHAAVTLDFERAGIGAITRSEVEVANLLEYARSTSRSGRKVSEDPAIRQRLILAYRDARLSRALGNRVLDSQARGQVANMGASESALHVRESLGRISETKALIYGMAGQLLRDTPHAVDNGEGVESWWQLVGRHGGGTIEIQKNIIAQRGLGLPR
jgi:alkylation response protein AidB-like acyl-CoA dehydrogenase